MEHFRSGKRKHGNPHAEPANLRQTDQQGRKAGTGHAKGTPGQQVKRKPRAAADIS